IALYLTDHLRVLGGGQAPPPVLHSHVLDYLREHGASFFAQIHEALGGFGNEVVDAMWDLVWKGLITNDTFQALRAFTRPKSPARGGFRSRRVAPPSTQGRWSLLPPPGANTTHRAAALAQQLLNRYGIVTREAPAAENLPGGFSAVYPVLKAMEDKGRVRRGYFVAGLGATQFASGGALELLRSLRDEPQEPETVVIAATDPANPYGTIIKWPREGLMRSVGARVILVNGALSAYVSRGEKQLIALLPDDEPSRTNVARELAQALASVVTEGRRRALLVTRINDEPASKSALAPFLTEAGFVLTAMGYQLRAALR
ncbi:MAG: Lhr family helicase, partial [Thermoanaerobaculia bacterium]